MRSVVLYETNDIRIEDFPIEESLGDNDVRIEISHVGICGSDVHYYKHGKIGPFVVKEPMILGHEASGVVVETGKDVTHLKRGDRVCMEPGIPDPGSRASNLGMYNVDPAVRFWATPPIHGCLRDSVVHPAQYTYKVPDNVSLEEAAMVEPLAIGVYAATRAQVRPGDTALVLGAGTIGLTCVLSALAAGCSRVIVSDVLQPKLDLAESFGPVTGVNPKSENLDEVVREMTGGWGVDVIFEASGSDAVYPGLFNNVCPGGKVVLIGMPKDKAGIDIAAAQSKEAVMIPIFRYAHVYPKTIALLSSGKIKAAPMISKVFPFEKSLEAFELAAELRPENVKIQIQVKGQ